MHLVGSIPLADAEAVFGAVADTLRERVTRVPDGETGERSEWTVWQWHAFAEHPDLEAVGLERDRTDNPLNRQYGIREGVASDALRFGPLGYAREAIASYARFAALRERGAFAPATRFQVSIPTAVAIVTRFVAPEHRAAVETAFERPLFAEVQALAAAIPPGALAIQWDVAIEIAFWERDAGARELRYLDTAAWFAPVRDGVIDRLVRACDAVPEGIELGVHLCYGNRGGRHFIEPVDTGTAVEIANALFARVRRPIEFLHLPVPIDRRDVSYVAPLRDLRLPAGCDLFLGLVHEGDGLAGAVERVRAASKVVERFGIATECGLGRREPAAIPAILALHQEIAAST